MLEIKTINYIDRAKPFLLKEQINYEKEKIISKNLVMNDSMFMSIMALTKGERIAAHKAPGDVLITILEGKAKFTIEENENIVNSGENILLPGNILHAVEAMTSFKMLLLVVK